jgi:hypothetical protein
MYYNYYNRSENNVVLSIQPATGCYSRSNELLKSCVVHVPKVRQKSIQHVLRLFCLFVCFMVFNATFSNISVQLTMQSVPITTDVVSSNLDQGEVYNIMW